MNIERIEQKLLAISRGFGAFMMGIIILAIVLMLLVKGYSGLHHLVTQKTKPDVEFSKYDYMKEEEIPLEEKQEYKQLVDEFMEDVEPRYRSSVEEYVDANEEKFMKYDSELEEKVVDSEAKKEFVEERVSVFLKNSRSHLEYRVRSIKDEFQDDYLDGLLDYTAEAKDHGIPVYTSNGYPVSNIAYSGVYKKYRSKFESQLYSLKDEDKFQLNDFLSNLAFYMALFAMIMGLITIAVMFGILRIEKHMARSSG